MAATACRSTSISRRARGNQLCCRKFSRRALFARPWAYHRNPEEEHVMSVSRRNSMLIAAGLLLAVTVPGQAAITVGMAAPQFAAVDSNGKPVKLSDYAGKIVVLEWT